MAKITRAFLTRQLEMLADCLEVPMSKGYGTPGIFLEKHYNGYYSLNLYTVNGTAEYLPFGSARFKASEFVTICECFRNLKQTKLMGYWRSLQSYQADLNTQYRESLGD